MHEAGFVISADGSFDITSGSIVLRNAFPAIDDQCLRPVSFTIDGDSITYRLRDGTVTLGFAVRDGVVFLHSSVAGFRQSPHWFYPVFQAEMTGVNRVFKQGLGFGGPSGVIQIAQDGPDHNLNRFTSHAWSHDTHLAGAVAAPDGSSIAVGALEHRRFQHRSTFSNAVHRFGLVDTKPYTDRAFFATGFAVERIDAARDGIDFPELAFVAGSSLYDSLHALAELIASRNKVRIKKDMQFHWDSWYEAYHDFNYRKLVDVLDGLKRVKPRIPFRNVMVDESWCTMGDWLDYDDYEYPGGLEKAFATIKEAGYEPGVWVGPFMATHKSKLFRDHPDWILKGLDGKPLLEGKSKGIFDGTSVEERYFLDTSHPDAFEFLRTVFRTFRKWGATVWKIDFMDWGFKDSTTVKRYTPGRTSVQYFCDVLAMIRQEIGEESYWINCISPFAPSIGYVDAQRLAYDTNEHWRDSDNVTNMFLESFSGQYANGVLWQTDTDALIMGSAPGISLNNEEVVAISLWIAMISGVTAISNRLHKLEPHRLRLFRFVMPARDKQDAAIKRWDERGPVFCAVRSYTHRAGHAVLFVNTSRERQRVDYPMTELIGRQEAFAFPWSPDEMKEGVKTGIIALDLDGHCSKLYYMSEKNQKPECGLALSGFPMEG